MTTVSTGGCRKCHYTLPDDSEVVEEYHLQTDELLVRKRRSKTVLGALGEWVYEVGEPPARPTIEGDLLRVSAANPILARKDRPHAFEWRVRNLSYPKSTYSVTIDTEQNQIVVRTSNKKYFKRIDVEELVYVHDLRRGVSNHMLLHFGRRWRQRSTRPRRRSRAGAGTRACFVYGRPRVGSGPRGASQSISAPGRRAGPTTHRGRHVEAERRGPGRPA